MTAMENLRSWKQAMARGFMGRCPDCGNGKLFTSYLKVVESCPACGADMHHQRADDLPPYLTILAVGHIIVPGMLIVEKVYKPELWVHAAVWLPLTLLLTLGLLPRIKGAVVGLQWALRLHGFDAAPEKPDGKLDFRG